MADALESPGRAFDDVLTRFGLRVDSRGLVPLAGDVGQRRYFRTGSPACGAVLVVYPEPRSGAQERWTAIRAALSDAGVRVPDLLDDAPDLGAALIEDLGDRDLALELDEASASRGHDLLAEAEELLSSLRNIGPEASLLNPPFDRRFFEGELRHTRTWAIEKGGARPLDAARAVLWEELASGLAAAASDPGPTGSPVPTHRDFHANNLMRAPDGRLAVIDFQDLRLGPPDYDPVSLRFERAGERSGSDPGRYDEAVLLERAWKVLGTFEKMLAWGREIYRPHRDVARNVIRRSTRPGGRFEGLLRFLDEAGS